MNSLLPNMWTIDRTRNTLSATIVAGLLLFAVSDPAHAFRCKSRIIQDGMHVAEVIRLCGEPVSVRDLGYVIRSYQYGRRVVITNRHRYPQSYGHFPQEVLADAPTGIRGRYPHVDSHHGIRIYRRRQAVGPVNAMRLIPAGPSGRAPNGVVVCRLIHNSTSPAVLS